ncbi:DUF928 domain-containing protein [Scytonema sp. NUACC26]|uniref:DUF928 domain-containing protein n=1 Tax=Scytonema sp. NUACC26 TaxID=3140176 RepID=UPI0034DBA99E
MYCRKTLLCSIYLGVALAFELAIALSAPMALAPNVLASELDAGELPTVSQSKIGQSKPPPPPRNPRGSSPGGRRDRTACPQDPEAPSTDRFLTALSPTTKPALTLAERPTFFVYVPKTSAKTAEFSLRNQSGSGVYRTTLTLSKTPELVRISLPSNVPPLEIQKRYRWSFAIICDSSDRFEDRSVTGIVQRTEIDPTRLRKIEEASLKERILLYQKANIWYDALLILYEARRTQPNDSSISTVWREFLQSGGVDANIDY